MISYIVSKLIIRGLALSITLIALLLPICANAKSDGFDYPAGAPNANNYYNAQGFGEWNSRFSGYHLGEDWNKKCGGDCDLGDTLSSISGGTVISKKNLKTWGNIVIMRHDLGNLVIDSMYAHLKDVNVSEGELINRGKAVGTVGKGENNIFPAHLHFEIRDNLTVGAGTGYGSFKPKGWQEPTAFINYHRPVPAPPPVANPNIAVTTKDGINTIAWDRASEGFDRYEVYRGGALVSTITDQNQLIFEDKNISGGNTYKCKVLAIYKNGQVGTSSEVDIEVKREVKKVTPSLGEDRNPFIYDGNVFYQSVPQRPGSKDLPLLYYYDIASGETKSVDISGCGFKYPNSPNANAGIVAFYAATTQTSQNDICYYNFSTDTIWDNMLQR
jgi:murein DD-endopeptidase MepM/ murein hydrolase activator NlpD